MNCVLALKSYAEGKQGGKNGSWKFGGVANSKPPTTGKPLPRRNSEPFMKALLTMSSSGDRDGFVSDNDSKHDRSEGVRELYCL